MIEADRAIAPRHQVSAGRLGLSEAFGRPRQRRLVDHLLVRLQPGHMGIAEQGEPVGPEPDRSLHGINDAAARLTGEAVHQVEVDRRDTGIAQRIHRPRRHLERLHAVDRGLHVGREVLYAEARAGHAGVRHRRYHRVAERARIDLDRDFGLVVEIEARAERRHQRAEVVGREQVRRAAAEMHVRQFRARTDRA